MGRTNKTDISYTEVDYAIDRVTVGLQKTTGTSFPKRQRLVAYHEAASAAMEYEIDEQVTKIVDAAYVNCKETLTKNKALLDTLATKLVEKETIDYDELQEMRDAHLAGTGTLAAAQ